MSNHKNPRKKQGPPGPMGAMMGGAPGEKAKDLKGSLKRLAQHLAVYKIGIFTVFALAIGSTLFAIVGPKILGNATTLLAEGLMDKATGIGSIDFDGIASILLFLIVIYIISSLFNYGGGFIMNRITQNVTFNLRKELNKKINRLPLNYFDRTPQGDVLSRVSNDVDLITTTLNQSLTQVISGIVMVIGILVMMISISWILSIVALMVIPLTGILIAVVMKRSQKYFIAQQKSLGDVNGHIEEMYGGHTVVKAFNGEKDSIEKFDEYNNSLFDSARKSQFLSGLMLPMTNFVGNLGYLAVCIVGGFLAINDSVSFFGIVFTGVMINIGDIQAFIQYVRQFNQPIGQIAQVMNLLQSTAAAAERVFEFLDEEEMEADNPNAISIYDENGNINIEGSVTFEDVQFGYNPDKIIINHFSMFIKDGQKVAIVGPTGAGKTTIVKLLMRFYELNGGSIYVGGNDITNYKREDLRSLFGMVLQDAWLFSGTIMENLRYSKPDASDDEVIAACKVAHVDHFVRTLEHGYDTILNEETSNISQGQKQLLTIARAFLANPKLLILDEATSNVDTRTEALIQKSMENLMENRTSFVIAHRLSTIKNADTIIVMKDGDIIEVGNHDILLEKGGFYAKLYNSQFEKG